MGEARLEVSQLPACSAPAPGEVPGIPAAFGAIGLMLLFQSMVGFVLGALVLFQREGPWAHPALFTLAVSATALALLPVPGVRESLRGQVYWAALRQSGAWRVLTGAGVILVAAQVVQAAFNAARPSPTAVYNQMVTRAAALGGADWAGVGLLGLAAVVIAPVAEELLFRGVLFRALRHRLGFWSGAVVSSVCFAAMHEARSIAPVFVMALTCCWLYERQGSLAGPIVLHLSNNLVVTLVLALGAAG